MVSTGALEVRLKLLPDGDIGPTLTGDHLVLEAASGSRLQALRLQDGLLALRGGRVQTFQVARRLPAAFVVRYPAPFAPSTEAERLQVTERARALLGLGVDEVSRQLVGSGILEEDLRRGGEALVAESMVSFCITGMSRCWGVAEACRMKRNADAASLLRKVAENSQQEGQVTEHAPSPCAAANSPQPSKANAAFEKGSLAERVTGKLQEKALSTALHLGCRGPAARVAGAAAAMTVEGYALYKEIDGHRAQLHRQTISTDQYTERACESFVSSSGRAIGSLAGAAMGQAAIPVPVVGAVIGGVIGGTAGGFHANSLIKGAWRLSGGKAKGGDDLVRCVEYDPPLHRQDVSSDLVLVSGTQAPAPWPARAEDEDLL
eukprot:TRINITY_DN1128_c0_g1_i2.p1 TRINITY_DN1128_c0_g1~~TRINITY_DN1128_c0_g1_i2.p1  ORF type:complete len:385 (+),score=73.12 TRINITY_DN1128_c0_g1_i2:30-1157(+)